MKKSLSQAIAVATLLGAAVTAQAAVGPNLDVAEGGVGSALLYPLFTVDNNNSTLVSVTNTTDEYKAVKVRFLEGMNSAEVLDFHLYLSPQDVWSGSIVATANGAKLMSNDTSCIVGLSSGFPKAGLEFRTTEIKKDADLKVLADGSANPAYVSPEKRTRVGHLEVIEMGVVDPATVLAGTVTAGQAIKHVNGKPGNCAAVTAAWNTGGVWHSNLDVTAKGGTPGTVADILAQPNAVVAPTSANEGLAAPTGGLYGTAAVINLVDSTAATYDATAMFDLYDAPQHPYPGTIFPHLLSGVDPLIGTVGFGPAAKNAVTDILVKTELSNDYYVDPALAAQTDFVITFPTKRFHVNGTGAPTLPFANAWNKTTHNSCDSVEVTYYDKEEAFDSVELEHISPLPDNVTTNALCYETNIYGMNDSDIYGGSNVRSKFALADGFNEGWMSIKLGTEGLPVVGYTTITTKNGVSAEGVVKNFGQTFAHKYK